MDEYVLKPAGDMYEMHMKNVFREYQSMSPEEWLARYYHTIACFSGGEYLYTDLIFHDWIHRLNKIIGRPLEFNPRALIESYRVKFLSEQERTDLAQEIAKHEF